MLLFENEPDAAALLRYTPTLLLANRLLLTTDTEPVLKYTPTVLLTNTLLFTVLAPPLKANRLLEKLQLLKDA
jgi:hypothetical protein